MQRELLGERQRRGQIAQVEHLDGRMRVAPGNLDLQGGKAACREVRSGRVGHAPCRDRELIRHTGAARGMLQALDTHNARFAPALLQ